MSNITNLLSNSTTCPNSYIWNYILNTCITEYSQIVVIILGVIVFLLPTVYFGVRYFIFKCTAPQRNFKTFPTFIVIYDLILGVTLFFSFGYIVQVSSSVNPLNLSQSFSESQIILAAYLTMALILTLLKYIIFIVQYCCNRNCCNRGLPCEGCYIKEMDLSKRVISPVDFAVILGRIRFQKPRVYLEVKCWHKDVKTTEHKYYDNHGVVHIQKTQEEVETTTYNDKIQVPVYVTIDKTAPIAINNPYQFIKLFINIDCDEKSKDIVNGLKQKIISENKDKDSNCDVNLVCKIDDVPSDNYISRSKLCLCRATIYLLGIFNWDAAYLCYLRALWQQDEQFIQKYIYLYEPNKEQLKGYELASEQIALSGDETVNLDDKHAKPRLLSPSVEVQ